MGPACIYWFGCVLLPVDVSGRQLTLAPQFLASGSLLYSPPHGLHGDVVLSYIGRRYLDEENDAPAPAYEIIDASIGYRIGRYDFSLEGFRSHRPKTACVTE